MKWPAREQVMAAARTWAMNLAQAEPGVVAAGCFGSYARGDAGVGSDLDLVVITQDHFSHHACRTETLPVAAECLQYTLEQWHALATHSPRFHGTLMRDTQWFIGEPPPVPPQR